MSVISMLTRARERYMATHLTPLSVVCLNEQTMMKLREELKLIWRESAENPFPPLESFLNGEVEVLGFRVVHAERVMSIV